MYMFDSYNKMVYGTHRYKCFININTNDAYILRHHLYKRYRGGLFGYKTQSNFSVYMTNYTCMNNHI